MTGQFSKIHLGILAAFLVAATLPVMAEGSFKGTGGNYPTAPGLVTLRPTLAEGPAFQVLPKYEGLPLELPAGFETHQVARHRTSTGGGRLARSLLRHVTWSWATPPPDADPVQFSGMLNRP